VASIALAFTTIAAGPAKALVAGNVDGGWGSPTPSGTTSFRWCYGPDVTGGSAGAPTACSTSSAAIQNPPGSTAADENQVRWGNPSDNTSVDGSRSGYGFNGSNSVGSITAGQPFFLGRFTHYNRPINASTSFTGTTLTVTVTGLQCDDNSAPTQGSTQSFVYTFVHEETNNNASPCPYGNSTGNGCDDRVTVNQVPATVFTCPEGPRTVLIQGFFTNANCHLSQSGATSTSFITGEGQDNAACLWASISAPPPTTTSSSTSTSTTTSSSSTTSSTVPVCGNGTIDAGEACDGGACCTAACQFAGSGSACGTPGTQCAHQDTCDGAGTCVDNGVEPAGTTCGDTGTACRNQDTCDGAGACVDHGVQPAGTPCGPSSACSIQDTCDAGGNCTDNGFRPAGTPCGDDGNPCTDDVCDDTGGCGVPNDADCDDGDACTSGEHCSAGACTAGTPTICPTCQTCDSQSGGCMIGPRPTPVPPALPRPGLDCRISASHKAKLVLKDKDPNTGDLLVWKWNKWPDISAGSFGDPTTTDDYAVCIFDGVGGATPGLVYRADVPAGGMCDALPCWRAVGADDIPVGFKYVDKVGRADGMLKISLKAIEDKPGRIGLRGKGESLPDPSLPLQMPVVVQLQTGGGECWGSSFAASGMLKNEPTVFKARSE
jgi:hypothetical protein